MNFKFSYFFEDNSINEVCDFIFLQINNVFSDVSSVVLCGSVAKILSGTLPVTYCPKDVDFEVKNYFVYRFIKNNIAKWFPKFQVKITDNRIILYTNSVVVEFWLNLSYSRKIKTKNKDITYIYYGN